MDNGSGEHTDEEYILLPQTGEININAPATADSNEYQLSLMDPRDGIVL